MFKHNFFSSTLHQYFRYDAVVSLSALICLSISLRLLTVTLVLLFLLAIESKLHTDPV